MKVISIYSKNNKITGKACFPMELDCLDRYVKYYTYCKSLYQDIT